MEGSETAAIAVLAGVFFIAWGAALPSADSDSRMMIAYRRTLAYGSILLPRGWQYGSLPFGLALVAMGVTLSIDPPARVVPYVIACLLGYVTLWVAAHPPDVLKPTSVRMLEAKGETLPPLDWWGRSVYLFCVIGLTALLLASPALLAWPSS